MVQGTSLSFHPQLAVDLNVFSLAQRPLGTRVCVYARFPSLHLFIELESGAVTLMIK